MDRFTRIALCMVLFLSMFFTGMFAIFLHVLARAKIDMLEHRIEQLERKE